MPRSVANIALAGAAIVLGVAILQSAGWSNAIDVAPFFLFMLLPLIVLWVAALCALRNVIARLAVILMALSTVLDGAMLISIADGGASTSPVGIGIVVVGQSVVAIVLLIASTVAGRMLGGGKRNGIV